MLKSNEEGTAAVVFPLKINIVEKVTFSLFFFNVLYHLVLNFEVFRVIRAIPLSDGVMEFLKNFVGQTIKFHMYHKYS